MMLRRRLGLNLAAADAFRAAALVLGLLLALSGSAAGEVPVPVVL